MPRFIKIISIILMTLCPATAFAQQTIINVPSSDVLPYGEIILKQSNKFRPFGNGKYVSLTPQLIMGTGKDTEISVEAGTNIEDTTSVKLNLTAKKVFRIKKSARFTVGGTLSPSLTEGQKPDSMIYAHGSYLCKKTRTTITAGGFVSGQQEVTQENCEEVFEALKELALTYDYESIWEDWQDPRPRFYQGQGG